VATEHARMGFDRWSVALNKKISYKPRNSLKIRLNGLELSRPLSTFIKNSL
jgi:hypothetical protein